MKFLFAVLLLVPLLGASCSSSSSSKKFISDDSYDYGYEWAEDYDISDFDDCQYEFGSNEAEDGCNDYIRDNYSGYRNFGKYDCTEDCSGHVAGYEWAEDNGISDSDDCEGYSSSFIEGCWRHVEDNY